MLRAILRPRTSGLTVSTIIAVIGWFQTDLVGVSRVFTVFVTFVVAYLVFNATAAAIERVGR